MGVLASLSYLPSFRIQLIHSPILEDLQGYSICQTHSKSPSSISGLVAEYIVAIDVTRVRFPADACFGNLQDKMQITCYRSRGHAECD